MYQVKYIRKVVLPNNLQKNSGSCRGAALAEELEQKPFLEEPKLCQISHHTANLQ
jgi:hypothetical protein